MGKPRGAGSAGGGLCRFGRAQRGKGGFAPMTALLMLCYKLWIENRMRFFVVLAITLCSCLLYVLFEGELHPVLLKQRPGAVTYSQFVYWRIYSAIPRVLFQV